MKRWFNSALTVISYINICFLISLTVVTVIDVIARYVFNTSFVDAMTISSFLLAVINALALPGITLGKGHVQVDLLYDRLPAGVRRVLDAVNSLLAGVLFSLLSWFAFEDYKAVAQVVHHHDVVLDYQRRLLVLGHQGADSLRNG